jgi:hypothetical protein
MKKSKSDSVPPPHEPEPFPEYISDSSMQDEQWKSQMSMAMHAAVNEALRGMEQKATARAVYWEGVRIKAMLFIARR